MFFDKPDAEALTDYARTVVYAKIKQSQTGDGAVG